MLDKNSAPMASSASSALSAIGAAFSAPLCNPAAANSGHHPDERPQHPATIQSGISSQQM